MEWIESKIERKGWYVNNIWVNHLILTCGNCGLETYIEEDLCRSISGFLCNYCKKEYRIKIEK